MGRRKNKREQPSAIEEPKMSEVKIYMVGSKVISILNPMSVKRDDGFLYVFHNNLGVAYNLAYLMAYECEFEKDEGKS